MYPYVPPSVSTLARVLELTILLATRSLFLAHKEHSERAWQPDLAHVHVRLGFWVRELDLVV